VYDAPPGIADALRQSSPAALAAAVAATMAGAWLVFEAWRSIARAVFDVAVPRRAGAHLYFTAQVLKYLPGRVWGFGYQALAGAGFAPVSAWLLASVAHFGLAVVMLVSVALAILGWALGAASGAAATLAAVGVYLATWAVLRSAPASRLVATSSHARLAALRDAWPRLARIGGGDRAKVGALLLGGTLLGFLAWVPLCAAGPWPLAPSDALQLAAIYGLSWLAGYVVVFTPAGLGVRELVFIALAPQFGPDVVATMAVLGRMNLLLADIALAAPFALARPSSG
jgi:uncharacterized membrane protein YbhN (UPF0104 family)